MGCCENETSKPSTSVSCAVTISVSGAVGV